MSEPGRVDWSAVREQVRGAGRQTEREPLPIADDGRTMADFAAEAAEQEQRLRSERWAIVCPRRFRHVSMEWVREEHGAGVHDTLMDWSNLDEPPNLVLLGPVGTGKTGTALAVCREGQMERGDGVLFAPSTELLDQLRPGGPDGALGRLESAPRLIVDDLGSERPTDWTVERLGIVVNRRWLEERPTIVTSNLSPDDLQEAVGERTFSRLVGGAVVVELRGADRRRHR